MRRSAQGESERRRLKESERKGSPGMRSLPASPLAQASPKSKFKYNRAGQD